MRSPLAPGAEPGPYRRGPRTLDGGALNTAWLDEYAAWSRHNFPADREAAGEAPAAFPSILATDDRVDDGAHGIVEHFKAALPSGSTLTITHVTPDLDPEGIARLTGAYRAAGTPGQARPHADIVRLFDGWNPLDPGVVPTQRWRPDLEDQARTSPTRKRPATRAQPASPDPDDPGQDRDRDRDRGDVRGAASASDGRRKLVAYPSRVRIDVRPARDEDGRHALVAVVGGPHHRRSGRAAPDVHPVQLAGATAQSPAQPQTVPAARPPVDDRPAVERAAALRLPRADRPREDQRRVRHPKPREGGQGDDGRAGIPAQDERGGDK